MALANELRQLLGAEELIADTGLPFGHEAFGHELRAEWLRAEWRKVGKVFTPALDRNPKG
jgi:hypothetical protein